MARKTIEYAVGSLAKELASLIKRAFKATGAEDLYDGRLNSYLQVIAQDLELKSARVNQLKATLDTLRRIIDGNI